MEPGHYMLRRAQNNETDHFFFTVNYPDLWNNQLPPHQGDDVFFYSIMGNIRRSENEHVQDAIDHIHARIYNLSNRPYYNRIQPHNVHRRVRLCLPGYRSAEQTLQLWEEIDGCVRTTPELNPSSISYYWNRAPVSPNNQGAGWGRGRERGGNVDVAGNVFNTITGNVSEVHLNQYIYIHDFHVHMGNQNGAGEAGRADEANAIGNNADVVENIIRRIFRNLGAMAINILNEEEEDEEEDD